MSLPPRFRRDPAPFLGLKPLAFATAAACLSWSAQAQETPSSLDERETAQATTLSNIVVKGGLPPDSYTAQSTTVGSKLPTSLKETPHAISVITRERIEEQNLTSLDEVLAQTPGVTVDLSGTGIIPAYYSRGYPIEYFQYDGIPIQTGGSSWAQPDMLMFERVEMLRGAGGLFNGAGQPGGVVNLVRKRPGVTPQFQGMASYGSWNNKRVELDYSTPFNQSGSVRGRFAAAYDDRESHIDYVKGERSSLYGIIEADVTARTTVSLGAGYQKRDWTPPFGGLPRYSDGSDPDLGRETFLSTPWTYWNFRSTQVFAELSHEFANDWQLKLSAVNDRETSDLKYGYTRGAIDPVTLTGPRLMGGANAYENKQQSVDAYLAGHFNALGQKQEFVIGANWYDRDADTQGGTLPGLASLPVNAFNPDPGAIADPGEPNWTSSSRTNTRQHGIYGSLRLKPFEPLTVLLGGRYSWWKTHTTNLLTGAVRSEYEERGHFTPYAGLVYDITPNWSAFVSYADIFRVQSNLLDANGNGLPPVSGANYEAGVKGSFYDGQLNTSFSIFRIDETDRGIAITDPIVDGCCYATNGKVRSQGFEVEVSGLLLPGWQMGAGYTFNTSKYLQDPANQGQPFRTASPKHMLRLWTSYQLPGRLHAWTVGGGINAQSGIYTEGGSPSARVEQGGYAVVNLRVGYQIDKNWSAALNVNNVFDRSYFSRLGSPGFGPATMGNVYGEPRSFMLSVRARY